MEQEAKRGGIDNPDLAENNERHKQLQLQKQKEGKGHWKPELANDSEDSVYSSGFVFQATFEEGLYSKWNCADEKRGHR